MKRFQFFNNKLLNKTEMKKFKFFTMALAAMSMVACSNEDEMGRNNPGVGTKGTGIEVQFDVDGDDKDANGTAYNPWETGDKLRFFITDYAEAVNGDFTKYEGAINLNRELAYDKTQKGWLYSDGADPATLSNVKARLYAYSPSQTTSGSAYYNGDVALKPNACPIVFNTPNKVDFMYGTHRNTLNGSSTIPGDNVNDNGGSTESIGTDKDYVDNKNNKTRLYMKHAQAYVEIRLLKNATDPKKKYSGEGIVTAVEIMQLERITNEQGKDDWKPRADNTLPTAGTCDATAEGKINVTDRGVLKMTDFYTGAGNTCNFTLNPTVASGTPDYGQGKGFALVCPEEATTSNTTKMTRGFHVVVDGKDFYIDAADVKFNDQRHVTNITEVEWKPGYKYVYNFVLTGKGLELVPDPENPSTDGDVDGDGISDFIVVKPWNTTPEFNQEF